MGISHLSAAMASDASKVTKTPDSMLAVFIESLLPVFMSIAIARLVRKAGPVTAKDGDLRRFNLAPVALKIKATIVAAAACLRGCREFRRGTVKAKATALQYKVQAKSSICLCTAGKRHVQKRVDRRLLFSGGTRPPAGNRYTVPTIKTPHEGGVLNRISCGSSSLDGTPARHADEADQRSAE